MKHFTLIEIVVAFALLSVAVLGLIGLSAAASAKADRALDQWNETHRLAQAAEYALTVGTDDMRGIPQRFFPYADYTAQFQLLHSASDDYTLSPVESLGNLPYELKTIQIDLIRRNPDRTESLFLEVYVRNNQGGEQ